MLDVKVKKRLGGGKNANEFLLDIEFSVSGGIAILVGASGSGKTTTLRLIAGILTPDEGFIKADSDVYFDSDRRINLPIQKRRVGYVFQDYALFPHLSAAENIIYGVKNGDRKIKTGIAREFLGLFHIEHLGERLPRQMSGGEQQRVALARALASAPKILLLDEPLSAVDVEIRAKLLDEIEAAHRRTNIPFIYVTHNESEAARLGNQRIRLQNGSVI